MFRATYHICQFWDNATQCKYIVPWIILNTRSMVYICMNKTYIAMFIARFERDSILRRLRMHDRFIYICIAAPMCFTHHNGPYSKIITILAMHIMMYVLRYIFYISIQDCKVRQYSLHPGQDYKEYVVFSTDYVFCSNCLECTLTHAPVFSTTHSPNFYPSFTPRCSPLNSCVFMWFHEYGHLNTTPLYMRIPLPSQNGIYLRSLFHVIRRGFPLPNRCNNDETCTDTATWNNRHSSTRTTSLSSLSITTSISR